MSILPDKKTTLSVAVIIFVIAITWNLISKNEEPQSNKDTRTPTPIQIELSKIMPHDKTGFIEGSVAYPSEDGNPSDMKIYAENITTQKTYMVPLSTVNEPNTFTDETKYKIEVPAGTYYVYAMTSHMKGREDYMSYYSEFVTCGLNVKCPSHEPIKVSVTVGNTTSKIYPDDWYNPQSTLRNKYERK